MLAVFWLAAVKYKGKKHTTNIIIENDFLRNRTKQFWTHHYHHHYYCLHQFLFKIKHPISERWNSYMISCFLFHFSMHSMSLSWDMIMQIQISMLGSFQSFLCFLNKKILLQIWIYKKYLKGEIFRKHPTIA